MNAQETLEAEKISKGQLGIIITVLSSIATTIYGYGSLTARLETQISMTQEMREDVKSLQETRFITNEAIKQIAELKQVIGRLETRVTYVERSGLEILTGVGTNGKDGAGKTQRTR